jgi:formylmethanofuran dehydrogenase subunit D
MVVRSASIAALTADPELVINPADRDRIGVRDGDNVRVTTGRGSLVLAVRGDADTPPGVAFVPFVQTSPSPADLIDHSAPVTDLRVETLK